MKHTSKVLWAVLIIVGLFSVSCGVLEQNELNASETYSDQRRDLRPILNLVGFVIPSSDFYLSFPIAGQITDLYVKEGDIVHSGDLIGKLDPSTIKSEIAKAEADLAIAQANLEKSKAGTHPALIEEAESQVDAISAENPVGKAQATAQAANVKAAQARLDYLKALPLPEDVALAEAEVNQRQIALETARLRLNQTLLVAPMDGTILEVYIQKFEYAGSGQPVVRLSNLDILQIETVIEDLEIGYINLGDKATITFDALPDVQTSGEVILIQPENLDTMSGKYIVTLSLAEQPDSILWGMSANVRFTEN